MIDNLLQPLVCERFKNDARYRDGHLRVVNALPKRRVVGLHSPEIKQVAKQLSREGSEVLCLMERTKYAVMEQRLFVHLKRYRGWVYVTRRPSSEVTS